ncbi:MULTISPECIES: hypothetical protein [Streptomyces]|uniref:Uncharacterized protein n=1 Tax=Streptomyces cyaneofuscatus TaxID=66883 RepID=A0ABZ1EYH3_9ACTN|nr:hypothetical protein [Streptomyces cyaneofuscatus]WSB09152.1 hypothetical protein OG849_18845 [Streptomyces cyaneofuscatus]
MNALPPPGAPAPQPAPAPPEAVNSAWIPWLLVMVLFSVLVGVCVGFLKILDGSPATGALLGAGAAFGATALLCMAVVPVVQQLRQRR